jgi:hypothetical protein
MRTERASERWPSGPAQAGGPGEAPLPVREIKKADSERALMTAASTRRYARLSTYVSGKVSAGPNGPGERRGYPTIVQASEAARDGELARRLWDASSRLTDTGQTLAPAPDDGAIDTL